MPRRWFKFTWISLVVFAVVLRFWQLGAIPVSLYWDEAAMLVDLKSVSQTGRDMHSRPWFQVIYPSYGDYKMPMYLWLAEASSKVFGVDEFALRFPSAVAGVLTVIIAGYLGRLLLEVATMSRYSQESLDRLQLWVMVIVTITPWSVMFSRTGFEGHVGQLLLGCSLTMLAWAVKKKTELKWLENVAFFLAPLLGATATYAYFSVRFVWPVMYVLLAGLIIVQNYRKEASVSSHQSSARKQGFFSFVKVVLGMVFFAALLLPMIRSPFADATDKFRLGTASVLNNDKVIIESNVYRELAGNTIFDRIFYHRLLLSARELAKNYSDNMSLSFLFVSGDPNLRHGTTQHGLFLMSMSVGFVVGILVMARRHFGLLLLLASWWIIALLPASVPENTPHALRSLNSLIPLAILIGFGFWWMWEKLKKFPVARGILVVFLLLNFAQFWLFYTMIYPKLSADDWQSGYAPLARAVTQKAQSETVWLEEPDDRFYLWLMAYGPYQPSEFQTWKSQDFKFQTSQLADNFKNVTFEFPHHTKVVELLTQHQRLTIAGRTELVQQYCNDDQNVKCTLETIADEVGKPKFSFATLEKKQ